MSGFSGSQVQMRCTISTVDGQCTHSKPRADSSSEVLVVDKKTPKMDHKKIPVNPLTPPKVFFF